MRVSAEVMVSRVDEGGDRDAGDPVGAWESWGGLRTGVRSVCSCQTIGNFGECNVRMARAALIRAGRTTEFSVLSSQFSVFSFRLGLGLGLFAVDGFPFAGTVVW